MKRLFLSLAIIHALLVPAAGQQPSATPNPPQKQNPTSDKDDVVRITSNLVQIDATVTDKKGRPVTNLRPEDFEILEDGKPQKITSFSFVSRAAETPKPLPPTKSERPGRNVVAPPPPPVILRPEQVTRTFALVVDDLGLSFESMHFVRAALRKFVDEQMQTGDLVAIIRTGAGVGALQQFTSDKRLLHAAIERVKWNSRGRAGIAAFAPIEDHPLVAANMRPESDANGVATGGIAAPKSGNMTDIEGNASKAHSDFKDDLFSVGTLGAINYIIRGLREMPGRKAVVLLSDTMTLFDTQGGENYRTVQALRRLTDLANRASVVIYTIDPRGLPVLNLTAADNTSSPSLVGNGRMLRGNSGASLMESQMKSTRELWRSQEGLRYLALETGGFFFTNNNDLNAGMQKALDDAKTYYLIGYRPDDSTFDKSGQRRYHNISVKVKQPDLVVRTRTGFFGISNEEATPVRRNAAEYLIAAITSPFSSGDIDLRLTSIFLDEPPLGSFMRSFIYVSGRSLNFKEEADGSYRAALDVLAMTFNDQGFAVDRRSRSQDIVVPRSQYQSALENGLIFGINLPVKTPGAFQLRIAVRDSGSGRVGSANQFIEVPDLKKERLTLSGLYLAEQDPARSLIRVSTGTTETASAGDSQGDPQTGPVIRRFHPGAMLEYGYEVYNTRLDKATRLQQLQSQVRLFRDNQLVFTGKVLNLRGQLDQKRLVAFGQFPLSPSLTPGDYVLQIIVTDSLAKEKNSIATQWIDFEIR
jgi:VWFA-related protein